VPATINNIAISVQLAVELQYIVGLVANCFVKEQHVISNNLLQSSTMSAAPCNKSCFVCYMKDDVARDYDPDKEYWCRQCSGDIVRPSRVSRRHKYRTVTPASPCGGQRCLCSDSRPLKSNQLCDLHSTPPFMRIADLRTMLRYRCLRCCQFIVTRLNFVVRANAEERRRCGLVDETSSVRAFNVAMMLRKLERFDRYHAERELAEYEGYDYVVDQEMDNLLVDDDEEEEAIEAEAKAKQEWQEGLGDPALVNSLPRLNLIIDQNKEREGHAAGGNLLSSATSATATVVFFDNAEWTMFENIFIPPPTDDLQLHGIEFEPDDVPDDGDGDGAYFSDDAFVSDAEDDGFFSEPN
jgi:hypothetical protein